MQVQGVLLEVSKGNYEGNDYASLKLRSVDVADNQILKYKIDLKKVDVDALNEQLDTEVTVNCSVVKGANDAATLKVISVE